MKGLKNIEPPLRLSFSPYVTTGFRSSPQTKGYLMNGCAMAVWT
jgi:hypothetical protein